MPTSKILLVEDDQNFGDVLKSYLEMHDYDVTLASDGVMGFESYRKGSYDLCIFDVLTRAEALAKIWGEDNYFTARSMDVFVTKLRKYLSKDPNLQIMNIHGNGFRLIEKDKVDS